MNKTEIKEKEIEENGSKECFVIMPIGDKEGYSKGHFKRVYEDIFKPAIEKAGFRPYRADDSNASHLIQSDIIKKIIETPMAICDLSTRNPNVLFELGIRQAFDKPVVLVQEIGTERIFDISSINTYDYKKERIYHEVLKDQEKICNMIKDTFEKHGKGECVNSILRFIDIEPAKNINSNINSDQMMKVIFNELMGIKKDLNERMNFNVNHEKNYKRAEIRMVINKIYERFKVIKDYVTLNPDNEDVYIENLIKLNDDIANLESVFDLTKLPISYLDELDNIKNKIDEELEMMGVFDMPQNNIS